MKKTYLALSYCLLFLTLASVLLSSCSAPEPERILVFSKTAGFRHTEAIAAGQKALLQLGSQHGIRVDTTENAAYFTEDSLRHYSAVVFLNTSGDVLDHRQQADFERYIQAGGGFVGIHAASDTEFFWPWFGQLVGAYFVGHPSDPNVQQATLRVIDPQHPSTSTLPAEWVRTDEWYNFRNINPLIKVLIKVDETTYRGGTHDNNHPIAWYHEYDGGRAFYTASGHTPETFGEPLFLEHLLGGIRYAMGPNKRNYAKATSMRVPEKDRFVKVVFAENLDEPMEMEIMPDGRIIFVERKGGIKLYDPKTEEMKLITRLNVHTKFEDGLLGIELDPDFALNGYIYLFYSPPGEIPKQHVSRFLLADDSLLLASERVVLEIPVQRDECCHSAGGLTFGRDRLLYISVGDNTNPFNTKQTYDSDGYSPMDERPGREPFDAQRSSGNTNDLRGKILRIRVEPDGTYTIPEGNLFPKDGSVGRPEIYVMGCRNPFRTSVNWRTGWLYWGDVGPDAGEDKDRGPRGYDELNQAKKAGFYGWPYFVANNKPYRKLNYETGEFGPLANPLAPENTSRNNTGARFLPPAQPPMIWYPYAETTEFPHVNKGGRNAMAGPTYHYDRFPASKNKLPKYYHNKLIAYDWMRNWILAVTLDEQGNYIKHEPMLEHMQFEKIIDMELGPDGALYLLEYGANWFSQNPDAVLARVDYEEGNRQPVVRINAEQLIGAAPFNARFSGKNSYDLDPNDQLSFEWIFEGNEVQSAEPEPEYTFNNPGVYPVRLRVTDQNGGSASAQIQVKVGNQPPDVKIRLAGNQSFFWNHSVFDYEVSVDDKEDGSTGNGSIPAQAVQVFLDYQLLGEDLTLIAQGHQQSGAVSDGKVLIEENGCKACHQPEKKSIGPSYKDVAVRYETTDANVEMLSGKIIRGGNGNWGDKNMSAHPQLTTEQAGAIVRYILSLDEVKPSLPLKGTLPARQHTAELGRYLLSARYTDKGGEPVGPLTVRQELNLRSPLVQAEDYDEIHKLSKRSPGGKSYTYLDRIQAGSYFGFHQLDLAGVRSIIMRAGATGAGYKVLVRRGSPTGPLIAEASLPDTGGRENFKNIEILLPPQTPTGPDKLFFTFEFSGQQEGPFATVDWLYFRSVEGNGLPPAI